VGEATALLGPFTLFLLMICVGLELSPADFRRVVAAPRAVIGGTLGQLAALPLLTWVLVAVLEVPPIFGAGAVLVAVSPGAGISNVLVAAAGANIALSVTLTALASVLSVVTLPTVAAVGMRAFLGDAIEIEVPVGLIMLQLALSLLLPIGLGMGLRARRPDFVAKHGRRLQSAAMGLIALILVVGIGASGGGGLDFEDARAGFLAAGVWTLAAMLIGWTTAAALRLPPADRFTFLIEFSTRNIAVAAIVAMSGLGRLDLTLFSGAYVAVGYPLAFGAVALRRWRGFPADPARPPGAQA